MKFFRRKKIFFFFLFLKQMKLKSEVEEVVFVFSFHTITTTTENIIITNASLLQELKLSTLSIEENNEKKEKKIEKK